MYFGWTFGWYISARDLCIAIEGGTSTTAAPESKKNLIRFKSN